RDREGATRGKTLAPAKSKSRAMFRMHAFGKLFYRLGTERWQVVRVPAGDETVVDVALLIDPVAARIADVGLDARIGRQRPAIDNARFHQHPRAMANRGYRLRLLEEVPHKVHGRF